MTKKRRIPLSSKRSWELTTGSGSVTVRFSCPRLHCCDIDCHEDDRWPEWLDTKVALLINRDGVDPREYGGKSYDEYVPSRKKCASSADDYCRELSKSVEQYIKQEDEGKFRCKTCQKLFKATSFVEKHIANKHSEFVKHLEEVRISFHGGCSETNYLWLDTILQQLCS